MTCQELLTIARVGRPTVRYASSRNGSAIGAWDEGKGRFVMVASLLIGNSGKWASCHYEILVDGLPMFTAADWVE